MNNKNCRLYVKNKFNCRTFASVLSLAAVATCSVLTSPAYSQEVETSYGTGDTSKYYNWQVDSVTGNYEFVESTENAAEITVKYDSSNPQERIPSTSTSTTTTAEGLFIDNNLETAAGGAIYNGRKGKIVVNADFVNNSVYTTSKSATGGAIYNYGTAESVVGDFIGNSAVSSGVTTYGGAFYNYTGATAGDITGDFVGNLSKTLGAGSRAYGGAIYSYSGGKIGNITGNFVGNAAVANSEGAKAYGGAIFNWGSIKDINGDFSGNYISAASNVYGGAIYNDGTIGNIDGDFTDNYSASIDGASISYGGAIFNYTSRKIGNINGKFKNNHVLGAYNLKGGAIFNAGSIGDISGEFVNNYAESSYTDSVGLGGAIYNTGTIGTLDADGNLTGGFTNVRFLNNYVKIESGNAKGGAIYSTKDLNFFSVNGLTEFSGNYVESAGERDNNAIYLDAEDATLTFKLTNNGQTLLNDNVDGQNGYNVNIIGDGTGDLYLWGKINNADLSIGGLQHINSINNKINQHNLNSLTLTSDLDYSVDVDLAKGQMDRFTAAEYGEHTGNINVVGMNLLSDMQNGRKTIDILFADKGLKDNVTNGVTTQLPNNDFQTTVYSPIYKYNVEYQNREDAGYFVFTNNCIAGNTADSFNPAVITSSTMATVGAVGSVGQAFNNAFQHSDVSMSLPTLDRLTMKYRNRYALGGLDTGRFSPLYQPSDEEASVWVKPYSTFESVPLKNGPKVNNISYGTIIGVDSQIQSLRRGWDRVITGYIGYNGASQRYSGVDSTQNGGLIGGTVTMYNGNFFNATTVSVGASVANNQNMYGTDNVRVLMSGIGNKTGYNFELKEGKLILQPSMLMSYTFVNTFDYTNAAGVRIDNKPLHALQLAPGVKVIGNLKNGWQPYASVSMVWNLMGESNATANGVKLPEMSIKPYVQYGVGVQKRIKDHFTAYGQAMLQNGGRNGVSLTAGFRWALGHDNCKYKDQKVKNKTLSPTISQCEGAKCSKKIVKQMTPRQKAAYGGGKYMNTSHTAKTGSLRQY